jgi:hypothetical protein
MYVFCNIFFKNCKMLIFIFDYSNNQDGLSYSATLLGESPASPSDLQCNGCN